jgi:Fe2+ or Zn2+ uptake regulation protein
MHNASKDILAELKTRGYRITDVREEIVRALGVTKNPITIQELAAKVTADEASVYRTIALLKKERLLEEMLIADEQRYALNTGHHHHIVCKRCNYVVHVPCSDVRPRRVDHPIFSEIYDHEVTYYGTCKKCN